MTVVSDEIFTQQRGSDISRHKESVSQVQQRITCHTAPANCALQILFDPLAPRVNIVRATLLSDGLERPGRDVVRRLHRHGHDTDFLRVW